MRSCPQDRRRLGSGKADFNFISRFRHEMRKNHRKGVSSRRQKAPAIQLELVGMYGEQGCLSHFGVTDNIHVMR
ncbi:unnamed protein product [Dibothriocephalus latus]|uniref:Uncharacterized protein n=1 Tax=Dibothriocephalus latus TaxID=60516 RepID=A0A3P7PWA3_DIBLA|nr:unnamed protein product [Dibothriocephalus latus]